MGTARLAGLRKTIPCEATTATSQLTHRFCFFRSKSVEYRLPLTFHTIPFSIVSGASGTKKKTTPLTLKPARIKPPGPIGIRSHWKEAFQNSQLSLAPVHQLPLPIPGVRFLVASCWAILFLLLDR